MLTRRRRLILIAIAVAIVAYVASYFVISRNSEKTVAQAGGVGFYYVPLSSISDHSAQRVHVALAIVYWPIWAVDHHFFGGPPVAHIPLTGVAGAWGRGNVQGGR
jgi:hypothetical protein